MKHIEEVASDGVVLAYIVRAALVPPTTTFLTPPSMNFQVGLVVVSEGKEIARHDHRPVRRHVIGTSEAIFVRKGLCEADVYNAKRELISTHQLREGDVALFVGGGHGFRGLEDTVLLEIKQGPYHGLDDKERF